MKTRLGVSLIELIVTLSACSAVLTISTALLHRAMHAQSRARSFFDGERSARRLAGHFRRDAREALSIETEDGAGNASVDVASTDDELVVRFEMFDGESIEYRQSGGRVERTQKVDERIEAREIFVFSKETRLSAIAQPPGIVALSIDSQLANQAAPPLTPFAAPTILRVEVAVGRNSRVAKAKNEPQL